MRGVAIGFQPTDRGAAERGEVEWVGRAMLIDPPGVLDPPRDRDHRTFPVDGLDLVVLQLVQELDGTPLGPGLSLVALPLGKAANLQGDQLEVRGQRAKAAGAATRARFHNFSAMIHTLSGRWIETDTDDAHRAQWRPGARTSRRRGWLGRPHPWERGSAAAYRRAVWLMLKAALDKLDRRSQSTELRARLGQTLPLRRLSGSGSAGGGGGGGGGPSQPADAGKHGEAAPKPKPAAHGKQKAAHSEGIAATKRARPSDLPSAKKPKAGEEEEDIVESIVDERTGDGGRSTS